jgi:hypothetical protein
MEIYLREAKFSPAALAVFWRNNKWRSIPIEEPHFSCYIELQQRVPTRILELTTQG